MAGKRLLIAFAHPDDESFGMGGAIARYVAEGADVYLICATNGDVGTVPEEMLNGYSSVAELRLAELDCAAHTLGFREVFRFGYRDSGMMGSESSTHPDCLWQRWQQEPEAVVRRVVETIRRVRPQVVVTFNRYGGYGHPDHIAIHQATVEAFRLAGDPEYVTEGLAPYSPQKLYYNVISLWLLRLAIFLLRLRGRDPRRFGRNNDIDLQSVIDHADPVHTRVDIGPYLEIWDTANACHASQGGGRSNSIPRWLRRWMGGRQGFTRVHPAPARDVVDENDLFAGVRPD